MTNVDVKQIKSLICDLCAKAGLTMTELARMMGLKPASISKWGKGKERPSVENLAKLADIFNVSVEELVSGQLHGENSEEYLTRNYDLSQFDVPSLIKQGNAKKLEEYFDKCHAIKKRYYELVPKWAKGELADEETKEFQYLRQYVGVLTHYLRDRTLHDIGPSFYSDEALKSLLRKFFEDVEGFSAEGRIWEMDKIFLFRFACCPDDMMGLRGTKAFDLMLQLLTQQHRDGLLEKALKKRGAISKGDSSLAQLVAYGNCVYPPFRTREKWEEEQIHLIEGEMVEDMERTNAFVHLSSSEPSYYECEKYDPKDQWKLRSYDEYQKTIMKKRTAYLRAQFTEKVGNPVEYFKKLKDGEYDTYLDI